MIEKYIKNNYTLKRYRVFKARKLSVLSIWLLLAACFFSFTAEFWSNSRPIILSFDDEIYFPVFKDYPAETFGITSTVIPEYKKLELSEDDWALWPANKWDPFESNIEVDEYPSAPSTINIMGTDDRGRDVFSRLLYGLRYNIIYAIVVWVLIFIIGTILGGIMGYFGGRVDFIGQRAVEILSTVPSFLLIIILIIIFQT
jgi:microcin C transport system permease protein